MYIVAIAWLYVTLMMAVTEKSLVAGILTFGFYGLAPCALVLWTFGSPARRHIRSRKEMLAASTMKQGSAPAPKDSASSVDEVIDQNDGADSRRH